MAGPGVIVACALAGLVVGWFVVARAIETLPEPNPLAAWQRVAVTIVTGALWGAIGTRLEAAPRFVASGTSFVVRDANIDVVTTYDRAPHGWGFVLPTLLLAAALVAVSMIDVRTFRIPDKITFPVLAVSLVAITIGGVQALGRHDGILHARNALIGMALYFVFLFLPHLISPRGMGFGDVKLGLVMGLYLGWFGRTFVDAVYLVLVAAFIGCVLGIVLGVAMNLVKRQGGAFPFGPALAAGTLFVIMTFDRYLTGV